MLIIVSLRLYETRQQGGLEAIAETMNDMTLARSVKELEEGLDVCPAGTIKPAFTH